jgi:hypothetical protein
MFLMSSQVKKFSQCELRHKKHQYFSIVSLPTDSVIVDHAVLYLNIQCGNYLGNKFSNFKTNEICRKR